MHIGFFNDSEGVYKINLKQLSQDDYGLIDVTLDASSRRRSWFHSFVEDIRNPYLVCDNDQAMQMYRQNQRFQL